MKGTTGQYASVNGLQMYYEEHGEGKPMLLLPGALSGIGTAFGKIIPLLSPFRKLIAIEFQGFGRTADLPGRELSYEHFTGDIIELLRYLDIPKTDIFGYSTGAGVALQVAMRRPNLVGKLVLASASYKTSGRHPDIKNLFNPDFMEQALKGSAYETEYLDTSPDPANWPNQLAKVRQFEQQVQDWPEETISSIKAPVLIITGDADIIQPEHSVALFKLLGGGSIGELSMPASRLAILPGTMHTLLTRQTELLMAMIPDFLNGRNETFQVNPS